MPKPEKIAKVEWIKDKFAGHEVVFITDFQGLDVDEINGLRFALREKGADYRVLKNTLTRLAVKDTEYEVLEKFFEGPVAAAFTVGDPMVVAKELVAFSKGNPSLQIKGGYMEGKVLEAADVKGIAALPSREILLSKLVGSLCAPLFGLSGVLSGSYRKLVYALHAVADAKSEAA